MKMLRFTIHQNCTTNEEFYFWVVKGGGGGRGTLMCRCTNPHQKLQHFNSQKMFKNQGN